MNRLFFLLIFFTFMSCLENKESQTHVEIPNLIKADLEILEGSWLRKSYLDSVKKYSSYYKAHSIFSGEFPVGIHFQDPLSNKVMMTNLHEGAEDTFRINDDGKLDVLYVNKQGENELSAEIHLTDSNSDTLLKYKSANSNTYIEFIKLEMSLRSYLINGNYKILRESDGSIISNVRFEKDNKLSGFKGYTNYSLIFDYDDDIPQYDLLWLEKEDGTKAWFAWEKLGSDFLLYGWVNNEVGINYDTKIGKALYRLVRM